MIASFYSLNLSFEQVQPKLIFAVDSVSYVLFGVILAVDISFFFSYNNKVRPHLPKLSALLSGLSGKIPQPKVVVASILGGPECLGWENDWIKWDDFITDGKQRQFGRTESGEIEWHRLPFDTPLWILFSSGTTGRPKSVLMFVIFFVHSAASRPIVHRAGGMLLQAKKELMICGDFSAEDVFFYYTTT